MRTLRNRIHRFIRNTYGPAVLLLLVLEPVQIHAARRYGGPGMDVPVETVTDSAGNVYVTGEVWGGDATGWDAATIKYSPSGSYMWSIVYSTAGRDRPYGIALDPEGHVYMAGASNGRYIAVRYSVRESCRLVSLFPLQISCQFENVQQDWVREYAPPYYVGNTDNHAVDIAASAGKVFLTGNGNNAVNPYTLTIALDAATGTTVWAAAPYPGVRARALAINEAGHLFVAGHAVWSNAIVVQRYNVGSGARLASAYFPDASVSTLKARGASVYVAGQYSAPGGGNMDGLILKYNTDLIEQWRDTPGTIDYANALAIDSAENAYVVGQAPGNSYIYKYPSGGSSGGPPSVYWTYGHSGGTFSGMKAIAIDAAGDVYATGAFEAANDGGLDIATMKLGRATRPFPLPFMYAMTVQLTAEIAPQPFSWIQIHTGAGPMDDVPTGIVTDHEGNVFVTGHSTMSPGNADFVTMKYSASGVLLW